MTIEKDVSLNTFSLETVADPDEVNDNFTEIRAKLYEAIDAINSSSAIANNATLTDITYGRLDTNGDVGTSAGQLVAGDVFTSACVTPISNLQTIVGSTSNQLTYDDGAGGVFAGNVIAQHDSVETALSKIDAAFPPTSITDIEGAVGAVSEATINYPSNGFISDGVDLVNSLGTIDEYLYNFMTGAEAATAFEVDNLNLNLNTIAATGNLNLTSTTSIINFGTAVLKGVDTPVDGTDAVNKDYVDGIGGLTNIEAAVGASTLASVAYSSNNYVTDATSTVEAIGDLDNSLATVASLVTANTSSSGMYSLNNMYLVGNDAYVYVRPNPLNGATMGYTKCAGGTFYNGSSFVHLLKTSGGSFTTNQVGVNLSSAFTHPSTTVDATSNSGQKVLNVTATTPFEAGQWVVIDRAGDKEIGRISSISAGVSLTMVSNLEFTHTAGDTVEGITFADIYAVTSTANSGAFTGTNAFTLTAKNSGYQPYKSSASAGEFMIGSCYVYKGASTVTYGINSLQNPMEPIVIRLTDLTYFDSSTEAATGATYTVPSKKWMMVPTFGPQYNTIKVDATFSVDLGSATSAQFDLIMACRETSESIRRFPITIGGFSGSTENIITVSGTFVKGSSDGNAIYFKVNNTSGSDVVRLEFAEITATVYPSLQAYEFSV